MNIFAIEIEVKTIFLVLPSNSIVQSAGNQIFMERICCLGVAQ